MSSADSQGAGIERMAHTLAWLAPLTAAAALAAFAVASGVALVGRSPALWVAIAAPVVAVVFLVFRRFGHRLLAMLADLDAESGRLRETLAALQEKEEAFRSLATHDDLTGLPNRSLFYDRLRVAIKHSSREGSRLAVLFLDLDAFKAVNDSFGHGGGDRVLVELAGRISAVVRGEDTVARIGGDEFIVLLPQVAGAADAARVALKVLDAVRAPLRLEGGEVAMSASIGVSVFPDDATSPESLVRDADVAMYRVKRGSAAGVSVASVDHVVPETPGVRASVSRPTSEDDGASRPGHAAADPAPFRRGALPASQAVRTE